MDNFKTLYLTNRAEWRSWLEENGETEPVIWLIFYKKHTGKPSLPYDDSVEEALCFGWIDSLVKRIDDEKYARKFTPRNPNSTWSKLNVWRIKKMVDAGKMTEKGESLFNYAIEHNLLPVEEQKRKPEIFVPPLIRNELSKNKKADSFFGSLAPSYKRNFIGWVMDAKREETRKKRLEEMMTLLEREENLGLK